MECACWVCFCCWHSTIQDMNVRIFWVRAMECICAQTRPWFILSSKIVFCGMESEPVLNPREKSPQPEKFSPEEDGTHDVAPSRTVSPTHYQWAIPPKIFHSATPYLSILRVPCARDGRWRSWWGGWSWRWCRGCSPTVWPSHASGLRPSCAGFCVTTINI